MFSGVEKRGLAGEVVDMLILCTTCAPRGAGGFGYVVD
jgi:hypothetical protein